MQQAETFGVRLEMSNPEYRVPAGLKCDVKFLATSEADMASAVEAHKRKRAGRAGRKPSKS